MPTVYVIGSANMDLVVRTPRIPRPGETILGTTFATFAGGKGANQAVAAAQMNATTRFVGRVGQDDFGQALRDGLDYHDIDLTFLAFDSAHTGIATITVEDSGQNAIVVAPGANGRVTPQDVERALATAHPGDVVLTQLEIPLNAVEAALMAGPPGLIRILNPAPAQKLPSSWMEYLNCLTPNEHEAALLTGLPEGDPEKTARALREMGVQTVLITLGAQGTWVESEGVSERVPSTPVEAVDTTAAGDAFNGALATFLAEGLPLLDAVRLANRAGALCATKPGAQAAMPTRPEVDALR